MLRGVPGCRQSPILGFVQSAPEARALSSASITRPQRSYGPLRLPSDPPPVRRGGCQPQSRRVSPDYAHHPSNVPCPIPRRIETGACVDCFPAHTAFPVSQAGRHPLLHFRDLLRLHSCYGPLDCSAAQGGLCHEAPARSVTRPSRSSATGAIDNSPDGILLHWCYAPSGRTEKWPARTGHFRARVTVRVTCARTSWTTREALGKARRVQGPSLSGRPLSILRFS